MTPRRRRLRQLTEWVKCPLCGMLYRSLPIAWALKRPGDTCGDLSQHQLEPCPGTLQPEAEATGDQPHPITSYVNRDKPALDGGLTAEKRALFSGTKRSPSDFIPVIGGPSDGDAVPYRYPRLTYGTPGRTFAYVLGVVDGKPAYVPAVNRNVTGKDT